MGRQNCGIRNAKKSHVTYAFVIPNIQKIDDYNEQIYIQGYEYTSGEPVVIHGKFSSGILNGDDLLVFSEFNGLASDDTPDFHAVYIEVINDRCIE